MSARGSAPRVAMIVDNDVTHDSRVLKTAATAAAAGCEVLVVGKSRRPDRWETRHGPLRIVRVPLLVGGSAMARALARTSRAAPARTSGKGAVVQRRAGDGTLLPVLRGRVAERLPDRLYPGWRNVFPQFVLLRRVAMRLLADFRPELVHAHDLPALDAGAHARGLGAALVYDAHEYARGLDTFTPTRHRACIDAEAEHIGAADRIITVSPVTAELLEADYGLAYRPDVVYNAPLTHASTGGGLRAAAGLPAEVPLLAYAGEVKPARGLDVVVDALAELPDVHFALVSQAASAGVVALRERAARLGVGRRVHVVPYVAAHAVSAFVADADAGISALVHYGNAEATLPTKLFDYLQAGVPALVSDVRASRELVADAGFGEPFRAGDPHDFARAARQVLAQPDRYRPGAAVRLRYAWETQGERLLGAYAPFLGGRLEPAATARVAELLAAASER